jgi:hypothetical protein
MLELWMRWWPFLAILAALVIPSLKSVAKYAPMPALTIPLFGALTASGLWFLLHPPSRVRHVLTTPGPTVLLVAAITLTVIFVYPMADGLKTSLRGSDADDAMIVAGRAMMHLENPYAHRTYFGNPFSPGPGWVALIAPFSVLGLYPFVFPLALVLTILVLRSASLSWTEINQFTFALFGCLLCWEAAAIGSDLPTWGLAVLGSLVLLNRPRLSPAAATTLAVGIGCLATARIPFLYLPALAGAGLAAANPRRAALVAVLGTAIALLLHWMFFRLNPESYTPLHLLNLANLILSGPWRYAAILCTVMVVALLASRVLRWSPITLAAWGLGAPMALLAAANLRQVDRLAQWNAVEYLLPALPLILFALLAPGPGTRPASPPTARIR